jgi:hypothetical protein
LALKKESLDNLNAYVAMKNKQQNQTNIKKQLYQINLSNLFNQDATKIMAKHTG